MTIGMEQHQIVYRVVAAVRTPAKVMDLPALPQRQRLTTHQTVPVLLQPKVTRRSTTRQGVGHLSGPPLLEVQLPGRIVGVGVTADFHVPTDRDRPGPEQENAPMAAVRVRYGAPKCPAAIARLGEVLPPHPGRRLVPVPPPCPTPQFLQDHIVYAYERPWASSMPVGLCPAGKLRVQPPDQLPGRAVSPVVLDYLVDLGQERPHALAGGLQEKLGPVPAYVLAQEVEAVVHMRDAGFLVGEFETPLLQEVCHERLYFVTQKFLRGARKDEVIRIAHQVDFVPCPLRPRGAEAFVQQRFQSIQGGVRQRR